MGGEGRIRSALRPDRPIGRDIPPDAPDSQVAGKTCE